MVYQVSTLIDRPAWEGWQIRSNFTDLGKAEAYARSLGSFEPHLRHRVTQLSPPPTSLAEFGQIDAFGNGEDNQ